MAGRVVVGRADDNNKAPAHRVNGSSKQAKGDVKNNGGVRPAGMMRPYHE